MALSAAVRSWAASAVPGPWFIPDETVYAELGRSLWRSGQFQILGGTPDFFSLVYPALAGLPFHVFGIERGYELLQPLQALVISLAAVPVYLWGRTLVSKPLALVAAALALCVPGLVLAGFVMTEVAFYPVFCLAAWAIARAVAEPTPRRQALALAAIALAVLTRLQAVALVPAYALAVLLDAAFAREVRGRLRPYLPSVAALAIAAVAWLAVRAAGGGRALGAYGVAGEARYDLGDSLRFVLYHAADVVLLTAVVPVVAFAAVAAPSIRGTERDAAVRAYVAVTLALATTLVAEVGVFASRFGGRIAERNLFELAPLFFLGLALWLHRGAPRTRALWVAAGPAFALLVVIPWNRLVEPAAEPDAFTFVVFQELRERAWGLEPAVAVALAAVLLLGLLLLPRRALWLVPAGVALALAGASVAAARLAADQADTYQHVMVGDDLRWIDRAADGPVTMLYAGDLGWSGGGPVWANLFWNDRVTRVRQLFGARVAGPAPRAPAVVSGSGLVVSPSGAAEAPPYAVAPTRLTLAGTPIAVSTAALALWRVDPPLRLTTRKDGIDPGTAALRRRARFTVYACRGGDLSLTLSAPKARELRLEPSGGRPLRLALAAGERRSLIVPLRPRGRAGASPCSLRFVGGTGVRLERLEGPTGSG